MTNPLDTSYSRFIVRISYLNEDTLDMPIEGDSATAASERLDELLRGGLYLRYPNPHDGTVTYFNLATAAYWQVIENEFYVSPEEVERERERLQAEEALRLEEEELLRQVNDGATT